MVYQILPNGKFPGDNPESVINPLGQRSHAVFLAMSVVPGQFDFRHPQGRRHRLATVLATYMLTRLASTVDCDATSR